MRIEAHNRFGNPINVEVTRVVVFDDYDNPVSISFVYQPGHIHTCHRKDPEFKDVLKLLGIEDTVRVEELRVDHSSKVPAISRKPLIATR